MNAIRLYGYDIADKKRREHLLKICRRYSPDYQDSVFESRLGTQDCAAIWQEVGGVLAEAEDSFFMFTADIWYHSAKCPLANPVWNHPLPGLWILSGD
jgi:CRISPR/Cas system-associated endoribonuclease Cas2